MENDMVMISLNTQMLSGTLSNANLDHSIYRALINKCIL